MTHNNIVSKDALVGIWKVVELKSIDKEQKISYPYGQNPGGQIPGAKILGAKILRAKILTQNSTKEYFQNQQLIPKF